MFTVLDFIYIVVLTYLILIIVYILVSIINDSNDTNIEKDDLTIDQKGKNFQNYFKMKNNLCDDEFNDWEEIQNDFNRKGR